MKRTIAFAVTALLLSGLLSSCKLFEDPVSLVDTSWKTSGNIDYTLVDFGSKTCTFTTRTTTSSGLVIESFDYSYTYNKPNVTFTALSESKSNLTGIVSGDMLSVTNVSTGKEIGVFYRDDD